MFHDRFFSKMSQVCRLHHITVLHEQIGGEMPVGNPNSLYAGDENIVERLRFRLFLVTGQCRGVAPDEIDDTIGVQLVVCNNLRHFETAGLAVGTAGGDDSHDVVSVVQIHLLHGGVCHECIERGLVVVELVFGEERVNIIYREEDERRHDGSDEGTYKSECFASELVVVFLADEHH